jgi:hypothetical protein
MNSYHTARLKYNSKQHTSNKTLPIRSYQTLKTKQLHNLSSYLVLSQQF